MHGPSGFANLPVNTRSTLTTYARLARRHHDGYPGSAMALDEHRPSPARFERPAFPAIALTLTPAGGGKPLQFERAPKPTLEGVQMEDNRLQQRPSGPWSTRRSAPG